MQFMRYSMLLGMLVSAIYMRAYSILQKTLLSVAQVGEAMLHNKLRTFSEGFEPQHSLTKAVEK